ncbi:MAG TPA: DUF1501 domain-containing protein [Pirellulales bacterium]|nr:DUF1501 domain-containing protein [Pirellulales bacterium]
MIHFFANDRRRSGISSRREWLRIGGLAGLNWLSASRRSAQATTGSGTSTGVPGFGKARSIILVYTAGGQSQLETWDPKPEAPETVRGEFRPIATSVPGTFVGEHMPRLARLADRYTIVRSLSHDDLADNQRTDMDHLYRQAFEVLASPICREAFDLSAEPDEVRDRYGRNRPGQACPLARRLVEAGVPLVTVFWNFTIRGQDKTPASTETYGWDTHNDIFEALKVHLLPHFDVGFSALLEDLDQRGLLDQTLVVCMGEFGRAPRIALEPTFAGLTPGRKHWPSAYSAVLAGAGITRGAVYGGTDRFAAQPRSRRLGPWDIAATMFSALGVNPATEYFDSQGRPLTVSVGQPIAGLYQ